MDSWGLIIPQRAAMFGVASVRELLALAPVAESSGYFDTVWVGDSLTSKARADSLTLLSVLAGTTESLRLAVGCMASFPVRDPALFAYQWASLDQVSDGRMLLAVCNGLQKHADASEIEGRHFGGVRDKERVARLEENLDLVRQLWSGEPTTFHGRFHQYDDITILPRPVQERPRIWISANPPLGPAADRVLERIATRADGLLTTRGRPGYLRDLRDALAEPMAAAGRSLADLPTAAYHSVNIGTDADACLDEAHRFFGEYYGPHMFDRDGAAAITAVGTPDAVAEQLAEVRREGAGHIGIRLASWRQEEQLSLLVEKVLPLLAS